MGLVRLVAEHRDEAASFELGSLPQHLTRQCRSLIESYHEVHGYACLPDVLWKSRLGPFIQKHEELRHFLKKASTTRSAKKSHEGFVQIATAILSLEILASSFAGWGALYPEAAERAQAILRRNAGGSHMPLMEFYLYPPKYISSAAIATLAVSARPGNDAELQPSLKPAPSGEKQALNHFGILQDAS
jgi:hypothetical protein